MRTYSFMKIILLCLAVLLAGINMTCRKKTPEKIDEDQLEPNAPVEPNTPAEPDVNASTVSPGKEVAVTVNDIEITESMVTELIAPQLQRIEQQSGKLPPTVAAQYKKQLREDALEQLIRRQLLDEKIEQANITITEEDVMNQIHEIASAQQMSLEKFKGTMEQYGRNFEEVKKDVRKMLSRNKFMEAQWAGKIDVTEEDAKTYYDENKKQFDVPEQIRASHILIQYELDAPNVDPNEAKAKAEAEAQKLLEQIKNGADFAELAKTHSDCPSAPSGGDLGFFPKGKTTPQFEKTAFALEVGQISDVVETEYGCHVIKVTDHKDPSIISFEQAKYGIIKRLTEKKQLEFAEKYIDSLKTQAKIVYPSKQ